MSSACVCHIKDKWCFYCEMYVPLKRSYAAEKELANELRDDASRWEAKAEKLARELAAAEAREKKLREAIEEAINEKSQWGDAENALDVVTRHLSQTLASLYPDKEGRTKKYTFVAILHIYNGIRTMVSKEQRVIEAESAEEAEKLLREKIKYQYKILSHLSLSGLQLELFEEGEAK